MKRIIFLILFLTCFTVVNSTISKFSLYGDEHIIKEIPLPSGSIVLSGNKFEDSEIYYEKIKVSKIDELGNYVVDYAILSGGYEPDICMRNLDHDPEAEYIITSSTGGSGGIQNIDILDLKDNRFNNILCSSQIEDENNDFFNIKSAKKITEIFKNTKNKKIYIDPPSRFIFKDINHDGVSEIICYQRVWVEYHANSLGVIRSIYKFNGSYIRKISSFFESKIMFFFNEVKNAY